MTDADILKQKQDIKRRTKLAEIWLGASLEGREPRVRASQLEIDGRRQAKVVRELEKEGLLSQHIDRLKETGLYQVMPKAVENLEGTKPDLCAKLRQIQNECPIKDHEYRLTGLFGKSWEDLSLSEKKYVFDFRTQYNFICLSQDKVSTRPYRFGEEEPWVTVLIVTDDEFKSRKETMLQTAKFEHLFQKNLPWAVVTLLHVSEETAHKFIRVREGDDTLVFGGASIPSFGPNPLDWQQDCEQGWRSMSATVRELQEAMAAFRLIQDAVQAKFGTWPQFIDAYRAALRRELES